MEINTLRSELINDLEMNISSNELNTWFKNIELDLINDNELIIYAENEFASDWIRMKYSNHIQSSIDKILEKNVINKVTIKCSEKVTN
ncbi:DnaA N-terminal domain-containing protein [Gottfriedia sp. OAE603]|uniref:DnaA N-terminal domain-containing protein n=1 Tax=Gottfriedia sp. OAE603 TaxID=2663872 RepID=UPI00178AFE6A